MTLLVGASAPHLCFNLEQSAQCLYRDSRTETLCSLLCIVCRKEIFAANFKVELQEISASNSSIFVLAWVKKSLLADRYLAVFAEEIIVVILDNYSHFSSRYFVAYIPVYMTGFRNWDVRL